MRRARRRRCPRRTGSARLILDHRLHGVKVDAGSRDLAEIVVAEGAEVFRDAAVSK